jgi:hypothetical protein
VLELLDASQERRGRSQAAVLCPPFASNIVRVSAIRADQLPPAWCERNSRVLRSFPST